MAYARACNQQLRQSELRERPIRAFTTHLPEKKVKDISMMGGASIIAAFLDAGEIDEFTIHGIPST